MSTIPPVLPPCGGLFTGSNGTLKSPNFPGEFPPGQVCVYVLKADPPNVVQLQLEVLETPSNFDNVSVSISDVIQIGSDWSHKGRLQYRTNVIYVIRCQKCTAQKILYVGEPGRSFETRVKEHIADVRLQRDTPVARHFDSDNGHSIQDLRAQIIWQAPAICN